MSSNEDNDWRALYYSGQPNLLPIVRRFGGWFQLLDPGRQPSKKFYKEILGAGCSRERFDNLRNHARDLYLKLLASMLYWHWFHFAQKQIESGLASKPTPFDEGAKWTNFSLPEYWYCGDDAEYLLRDKEVPGAIMPTFKIGKQDIEQFIIDNPDLYSPEGSAPASGTPGYLRARLAEIRNSR